MFTGIIRQLGTVTKREDREGAALFNVAADQPWEEAVRLGDSICVSGVCLTAAKIPNERTFTADVMGVTLRTATLGGWQPGQRVNLELALQLSSRIGGHLLQGHVDGQAELLSIAPEANWKGYRFSLPPALAPLIAAKGSVAIDGVSLTVSEVSKAEAAAPWFEVSLIPETLKNTTLGGLRPGDRVNLETDFLARQLKRLQEFSG